MSMLAMGGMMDAMGMAFDMTEKKRDRKLSQRQFDQQMDHSVRRRVLDAQRAGIHPLFALGASVGASPTISYGGGEGPGKHLSNFGNKLAMSEAVKAATAKDYAEAAYWEAEAGRVRQEFNGKGRDANAGIVSGVTTFPYDISTGAYLGPTEPYAPPIPATQPGRPGTKAGRGPAFQEFQDDQGRVYRIFSEEMQADEINQVGMALQWTRHKGQDFHRWLTKNGYIKSNPGGNPFSIRLRKTKSRKEFELYRRNGGTLTWDQWKKEGN